MGAGVFVVPALALAVVVGACREPGAPAPASSATPVGAVSASASAVSPAKPVVSSAFVADVAVAAASAPQPERTGGLTEWARDQGKQAVGVQHLQVEIGGGVVRGTSHGVLGDQLVVGVVDDHGLALELTSSASVPSASFSGVATAAPAGSTFTGSARWSRGDGLLAREGRLQLRPR